MVERIHYRRSRFVFAVSPIDRAAMQRDGIRVDGIVANGVDMKEFASTETAPTTDRLRVLSVGSETVKKGLDLLLSAVADPLLQDRVALTIVTRHENHEALAKLASELGLANIEILTNKRPASTLFRNADVYVAASRQDAFNMPALEAMASGVPVLITDQCGLVHWMESAEALVVNATTSSIRHGLRRLVDSPELRMELSQKGIRFAREMSWSQSAESMSAAFAAMDDARGRQRRRSP
ncbi:MAG: glycosyltransferase [Acidimicrobiales bacterium]|nr:glycosyltransferase [Acidimicrobiales bacterium]